jgi:hypothetical protein
MLLLDVVSGMDLVFGIKDIITIGGGIIATLTAFFTLKFGQKSNEKEMETLKSDIAAEKLTRHSMKKEVVNDSKERELVIHNRIDKTQDDFKNENEKNSKEFSKINDTISGVKQDTSEIKGMVQTLINKN